MLSSALNLQITFEHATRAQVKFMESYPEAHAKFSAMMSAMAAQQ